jgi:ribosomal protein L1
MEKKQLLKSIETLKKDSPKRNFDESVDFIINFKDLDSNNPDHKIDFLITLPYKPKEIKVCAFVGPETTESAKEVCDIVSESEFKKQKNLLINMIFSYLKLI